MGNDCCLHLFGTLFGDMFPWLRSIRLYSILGADVYLFPVLIALCLSGFIIRQNLHGPKAAAKAQSFLTKALLAGLLLAIISAFDKGSLANWQPLFFRSMSRQHILRPPLSGPVFLPCLQ